MTESPVACRKHIIPSYPCGTCFSYIQSQLDIKNMEAASLKREINMKGAVIVVAPDGIAKVHWHDDEDGRYV